MLHLVGARARQLAFVEEENTLGHLEAGQVLFDISAYDALVDLCVRASDDARDPLAYTLPGTAIRGRPEPWSPPDQIDLKIIRVAFTDDFGFAPTERAIRRAFRKRVERLAPSVAECREAAPDCAGAPRA